ncbi:MAG TPA: tetratricopeptide repeat protein, partial [Ktedonobacteraceae bacterium]|nr:tetratricopeptide repeat protein [Ktedonobacteraceae bacterium]
MDDTNNIREYNTSSQNGVAGESVNQQAQEWTDKGNSAAEAGDYETAAEAFERAIEANPGDGRARYNLALAQQYLGDLENAISGYQRAIDIDPGLIDAYINLGNLYGEIGMSEESLETFQQALEYDPDNDALYLSIADTYRAQYLYQDAIQNYRQAIIINPENTVAADNLADVRERVNTQLRRVMEQEKRIDEVPDDTSRYGELV